MKMKHFIIKSMPWYLLLGFVSFIFLPFKSSEAYNKTSKTPQEAREAQGQDAPLTLFECYELALKQSEIIAIDSEIIKETEARFIQAFSALLPHVTFVATKNWQDPSAITSTSSGNGTDRKFVFTQTLFSGFKELAGISSSKFEHKQRTYEKARAEQLLFSDVADAFYLFKEKREDLFILETIQSILENRIQELLARVELGRSRRSEIVNTQAQLYAVEAEMELVKSQEALSRQLLEFLIGKPLEDVDDSYTDNIFSVVLKPEGDYTANAEARPDVLASQMAWNVAKKMVTIAKSGYFPTITAENNYYTHRDTPPVDMEWDAQLKISVPIFDGLETYGEVKEASAKAKESELQYMRDKRSAVWDIRNAYVNLHASLARSKALKKALNANEMNYTLQKEDYQLNLINNLDLLIAIKTLADSRRNYIQAFYETKRFYWQLRVANGEIDNEGNHGTF